MKKNNFKKRVTVIDDLAALRAFVMPELYPFLLEVYAKEGKNEDALRADVSSAREKYKELVKTVKRPSVQHEDTSPKVGSDQTLGSSVLLPNPSVQLYEELH